MTAYLTTADTANACRSPGYSIVLHRCFVSIGLLMLKVHGRPVNPGPRALDVGHCIVSINVARPSYDRCRTHVARSYIRAGHLLGSKVRP